MTYWLRILFALVLCLLAGCETMMSVVNNVDEREANEIIVFLASRGIKAQKTASSSAAPGAEGPSDLWNITVGPDQLTEAMALLNQNGLPRIKGTTLLDLFAKQGLMTSEKEETIRYQAGLAEQIATTIRKIDGVLDATVQLSFPEETMVLPGSQQAAPKKVTAAVYVKHQGIVDDPNSHLVTKIKRLVAGSVNGLDVNDVTVISDRSRLNDITLTEIAEEITGKPKEYVSIWSIVMSKSSAGRFRTLFFALMFAAIAFAILLAWLLWKFYPILKKKGLKEMMHPVPIEEKREPPPEERR